MWEAKFPDTPWNIVGILLYIRAYFFFIFSSLVNILSYLCLVFQDLYCLLFFFSHSSLFSLNNFLVLLMLFWVLFSFSYTFYFFLLFSFSVDVSAFHPNSSNFFLRDFGGTSQWWSTVVIFILCESWSRIGLLARKFEKIRIPIYRTRETFRALSKRKRRSIIG